MKEWLNPYTFLFFHAFIFGVQLSIIYSVNRIFRIFFRHPLWLEYFEDFIFWCVAFAAAILFLYRENHGEVRWFLPAGAIIGTIVYEKIFGKWITIFSKKVVENRRRNVYNKNRVFGNRGKADAEEKEKSCIS